jgi:hypothetical protein
MNFYIYLKKSDSIINIKKWTRRISILKLGGMEVLSF